MKICTREGTKNFNRFYFWIAAFTDGDGNRALQARQRVKPAARLCRRTRTGMTDRSFSFTDTRQSFTEPRRVSTDIRRVFTDIRRISTDIRRFFTESRRVSTDIRRFFTDVRRISADIRENLTDTRETPASADKTFTDIGGNIKKARTQMAAFRQSFAHRQGV